MRITSGTYKGRQLKTPKNGLIRPTSDKIRQAIFNIIQHAAWSNGLEDKIICDGFAGTGAMGFEAISRGAKQAYFFDISRQAIDLMNETALDLGIKNKVSFFKKSVLTLQTHDFVNIKFDLIFLDPPYNKGMGEKALDILINFCGQDTIIVLEEDRSAQINLPPNYQKLEHKTYGNSQILFLKPTKE